MEGKETFEYTDTEGEYVVRLKSRNYWWLLLLLLLLLPLLLLLRFEKTVVFETLNIENGDKLSGVNVRFSYLDRRFFKINPLEFFTVDTIYRTGQTAEDGQVIFQNVYYSLFSKMIYAHEPSVVVASGGCLASDSLTPAFHSLRDCIPTNVKLAYTGFDINFRVLDLSDNQPLPDAQINAYLTNENKKTWSTKTDADGSFIADATPLCAFMHIEASLEGYEADTLDGQAETLASNILNRTLYLKPKKGTISFVVEDIQSGQHIAGVSATLKIEGNTPISFTTNTNGVGKGVFDSVALAKNFRIDLSHVNYHDTSTTEYKVIRFAELAEGERTFKMRPQIGSLIFRDVDTLGHPVVGAKNVVNINGLNVGEFFSNDLGCFSVGNVKANDKISIVATKPGYKKNSTKINGKTISDLQNQYDRDIPLTPNPLPKENGPQKNCGVHFSGTLLADKAVVGHISRIYQPDKYGEYVGNGEYPDNTIAFPNAVKYTFDAIAVDAGTRLVIYAKPNFEGNIVLDVTGPVLINNVKWKNDSRIADFLTRTFSSGLQANYPPACRQWSSVNMNEWDHGSVKITCGLPVKVFPEIPKPDDNAKDDNKKKKDKKKK